MKRFLPLAIMAPVLAGCTFDEAMQKIDASIGRTNAAVAKYAPVIGRDLIMVGNIIVTAECSPMTPIAGQEAGNLLRVIAPDSKTAEKVNGALARNTKIAAQLCPLVAAIQTGVGAVPKGAPSQVVAIEPAPTT
jgi:hypothetical protein